MNQGRTGDSQEFSDLINTDASYGNRSIWQPQLTNLLSSTWGNGATFYSLNGYVLANNPIFEACKNEDVIWYTYAYGSGSHVFHMHGNGFTENGHSMPSISESWSYRYFHLITANASGPHQVSMTARSILLS
jgi:FtsP/CotA-like multicopper oxidase with cupredoxin domain